MTPKLENEKQSFTLDRDQLFLVLMAAGQVLIFGALWLLLLLNDHPKEAEQKAYLYFFVTIPPMALLSWAVTRRLPDWQWSGLWKALPWLTLSTAIPALVLIGGLTNINRIIYYSYDKVPRVPPYSVLRFSIGAALAALCFATFVLVNARTPRLTSGKSPILAVVLTCVGVMLLLGMFDPYLMIDTLSYSPYVGPAFAMRNGAIPMIDTFSQYGPNFVLFAWFFAFAQTFYMASAMVTALNVVMGLAFVSIAISLGKNRWFSFFGGVVVVLFLHAAFLYNITYTPSVFAMRFLPPLLLMVALVRIPHARMVTSASSGAMVLCTLWSFEAFFSAVLVYLTWLFVRCVSERRKIGRLTRDIGFVLLLALAPHAILTLAYLAAFGTPPRYDIYFELVFAHLRGNYWLMPVETKVYAWILFAFVYASALAIAAYKSLTGADDARLSAGVAAVAVLGVLEFYYYVGRSATPILVFISLPMMLLVLLACDWAVNAWRMRRLASVPLLALPTLGAAFVLFACMGGVWADRWYEPISRDLSNSALLRVCMPAGDSTLCSSSRMAHLIAGADVAPGAYPATEAGGSLSYTHPENEAEFELARRFALDGERRVLLFGTDPVPVIFHSSPNVASRIIYPPHSIGIVYPSVDGLSPTLSTRALTILDRLKPGDVIVRGKLPIYDLDKRALTEIEARWMLCPKDKVGTVEAFELASSTGGACNAR